MLQNPAPKKMEWMGLPVDSCWKEIETLILTQEEDNPVTQVWRWRTWDHEQAGRLLQNGTHRPMDGSERQEPQGREWMADNVIQNSWVSTV